MILKPFKIHSPDGKSFYEGDAPDNPTQPTVTDAPRAEFESWADASQMELFS